MAGTIFKCNWRGPFFHEAGRVTWTLPLESDVYLDMTVVDNRTVINGKQG